ncbi:MAG: SdpI family protein [Oscillospiraceae bacterium]|nr:SdpI family protein [Oscillospiraceae bacterium]
MDDLDLGSLIPSLDSLLGWLDLVLRVAVMAGPLAMLGLGLFYFLAAPKEANWTAGYRFRYGMAKVQSWQFMQRLAGIVFSGAGLVLTVIMTICCAGFKQLPPMDMAMEAGKLILWELVILVVAKIGINVTVIALFDSEGNRRSDFRGMKI